MLVFKRWIDQDVVIGDEVTVRLLETGPGWAKLGIVAPKEVPVHRDEVYRLLHGQPPQARPPRSSPPRRKAG